MAGSDTGIPQNILGPGASPKILYVFFLLRLCTNYFETMRAGSDGGNIDAATAALVTFCPDREARERIWKLYEDTKAKKDADGNPVSQITASVMAVGDLISYLSETLEFTETVTGGFL